MDIIRFGEYYISDFVENKNEHLNRKKYSMDLKIDTDIKAVKLVEQAPLENMYGKYWYRSGINTSMVVELKNIVTEVCSRVKILDNDVWLDIACNDGTLLSYVPDNMIKCGIDPADDSYYNKSSLIANVVQDYFSESSFKKLNINKKCKIITTIAMFYDLENPNIFIDDINKILDDNGVWILQLSYTPLMIEQMAFDNICHEHQYYYSLDSMIRLLDKHNMKIVDCDLNDVNGGSFRIYVQKKIANITSFGTYPLRSVCNYRINSILKYECDISDLNIWTDFFKKLELLKEQTVNFIKHEKSIGKTIYGYGASTKGNTLLQYYGLDDTLITAIAERSPYKYGLYTIGTNIPIISEEQMRSENPDYLLILPWHFIKEFVDRERDFLERGGKFIVPCPEFKIIGK